jgi:hypothetical protein
MKVVYEILIRVELGGAKRVYSMIHVHVSNVAAPVLSVTDKVAASDFADNKVDIFLHSRVLASRRSCSVCRKAVDNGKCSDPSSLSKSAL